MDIKRFIIGTVVGGIAFYILGYIIWDILVADFYAANRGSAVGLTKDAPVLWAAAVGTLAYAALVTLGLGTRAGATTVMDGVKVGAVVGFLLWLTVNMIFFAYFNISNLTVTIVDPLLEAVRAGLGGAVIAVVLGKVTG